MFYFIKDIIDTMGAELTHFVLANLCAILVSLAAAILSLVALQHLAVARADKEWEDSGEGVTAKINVSFVTYERARGNIRVFDK